MPVMLVTQICAGSAGEVMLRGEENYAIIQFVSTMVTNLERYASHIELLPISNLLQQHFDVYYDIYLSKTNCKLLIETLFGLLCDLICVNYYNDTKLCGQRLGKIEECKMVNWKSSGVLMITRKANEENPEEGRGVQKQSV